MNRSTLIFAEVGAGDWLTALAIMASALVLILAVGRLVRAVTKPLRFQDYIASLITRFVGTVIFFVAAVYALAQLSVEVGPLLGALGIGGIIIAMSLQPVLGNLVGSMLLHARRPIRRGDQIESNGRMGTVLDITGRAVILLTFDGEVVYLPNLKVLEEPLVNRTAEEFRRTQIPFQVGYDADLRQTTAVLESALADVEALAGAPRPNVQVTGFGDSGVDLVARFWHPSEELTARWAMSEVATTIRETLSHEGITIPFPQRVVHMTDDRTESESAAPLADTGASGPERTAGPDS